MKKELTIEDIYLYKLENALSTKQDWERVLVKYNITKKLYDKYYNEIDFEAIEMYQDLDKEFIRQFYHELFNNYMIDIFYLRKFSDELIEYVYDISNKRYFAKNILKQMLINQELSNEFLRKVHSVIIENNQYLYLMCSKQKLNQENLDFFYWRIKNNPQSLSAICKNQNLNMNFLKKHSGDFTKNCWRDILKYQILNEGFVFKYEKNFNRHQIAIFCANNINKLSDNFICKYIKFFRIDDIYDAMKNHVMSEKVIDAVINKFSKNEKVIQTLFKEQDLTYVQRNLCKKKFKIKGL